MFPLLLKLKNFNDLLDVSNLHGSFVRGEFFAEWALDLVVLFVIELDFLEATLAEDVGTIHKLQRLLSLAVEDLGADFAFLCYF